MENNKTPALYDLDQQFAELDALLEASGGDLDAEKGGKSLAEWVEQNQIATAAKVDSYAFVIERILGDAVVCDEMIARLKNRRDSMIAKADRLKAALQQSMDLRKIVKIDAPAHTIWRQKNGGKVPMEILVPEDQIPNEYKKAVLVVDKERIRKLLEIGDKETEKIAKLGEVGTSLRIR